VSEAGSFRSVLTDEAVGVLIGPSLPGVVGRGEEEVSAGGRLNGFVAMELGAVVDSYGSNATLGSANEFDGAAIGGFDGSGLELSDQDVPGLSVDEGEEAVPVGTENRVTLQVSDTAAVLGTGWPLGDGPLSGKAASGIVAAVAFATLLLGAAKVAVERASTPLVHPDVAVDGLVTDPKQPGPVEPTADLLRAEVLPEPHLNELPVGSGEALVAT